jgi:hypothetical protein
MSEGQFIEIVVDGAIRKDDFCNAVREQFPALKEQKIKFSTTEHGNALVRIKTTDITQEQVKEVLMQYVDDIVFKATGAPPPPPKAVEPPPPAKEKKKEVSIPPAPPPAPPKPIDINDPLGPDAGEIKEIEEILKIARNIPGAVRVIKAALDHASVAHELVQRSSQGILSNVAGLETAQRNQAANLELIENNLEKLKASVGRSEQENNSNFRNAFDAINIIKQSVSDLRNSLEQTEKQVAVFGGFKELLKSTLAKA